MNQSQIHSASRSEVGSNLLCAWQRIAASATTKNLANLHHHAEASRPGKQPWIGGDLPCVRDSEIRDTIMRASRITTSLLLLILATRALGAVSTVSPVELRRLQLVRDSALSVVDVRPPTEFRRAHIQGAVNVPAPSVLDGGLSKNSRIVVYCAELECPLSSGAVKKLTAFGYPNVALLDGGLAAWQAKGYPVDTETRYIGEKATAHRRTGTAEFKQHAKDGVFIIDVRPLLEFKSGHIRDAHNYPLETLPDSLNNLPKTKLLIVCDRSPMRSRKAADALVAAGYNVSELSGGISGWAQRGNTLRSRKN